MTNIPPAFGYSPQWWRQGTNFLLEKKPGNWWVDKLRMILLYEADLNFLKNKKLGWDAIRQAEQYIQVTPEQYWNRCGGQHQAIRQVLNRWLTFDIIWQRKILVIMCSSNMKSCYNHILQPVASLCLHCMGVLEAAVVCTFTSIQLLQHHVCTAYGNSNEYFGREDALMQEYQGQVLQKAEMF